MIADTDQVNSTSHPVEARTLQRSLRALGGVLAAYASPAGTAPAPFDDSCLTRTLRGYFEDRRWRTVVLAAISPSTSSLASTIDNLSFLALKPVPSSPAATSSTLTTTTESAAAEEAKKLGLQSAKRRAPTTSDPDVLLVEDVPVSKRVAQVSMQRASYKVEAASDGETAVELFKTHWMTLKIVLMDIGLPKMSGVEATKVIREFEATQPDKSPVIVLGLTSNMESENLEEYRLAGMNGCIMKGSLVADAVNGALKQLENEPRKFVTLVLGGGTSAVSIIFSHLVWLIV
jgi:CheY-like chemotaxis protein